MPRSEVQLVGCSVRLANPDGFFMAGVAEWTIKQVDSSLDALAQNSLSALQWQGSLKFCQVRP
jgi:hypothetical protein